MSPKEDLNDILQSFVDHDLASLDRVGGESESFSLSPHLAQPSPDLALGSGSGGSFLDADTSSRVPEPTQNASSTALRGPVTSESASPSFQSQTTKQSVSSIQQNDMNATTSTTPSSDPLESKKQEPVTHTASSEQINDSPVLNAGSASSAAAGSSANAGSNVSSPYFTPDLNKEASKSEPKTLPKKRTEQNDPLVAAVESQNSRHASSASTNSAISGSDREHRRSLGHKLKAFGKRITSGNSTK